jgi:phage tail-like protein
MAHSSLNSSRPDPYKNFKFHVTWNGRTVAAFSKVAAVGDGADKSEHRGEADPSHSRKSPGRTEYDAITLDRGVTHDTEFASWASKVWALASKREVEVSLNDFRKDIVIEVYNEDGQLARAYKVFRCWVSGCQVLPDLDANVGAIAIQHIRVENEGWERDPDVGGPSEPQFTDVAD